MASDVLIVGGGISGLATAFYLKQLGLKSTLIEKSARLGGLIRTDIVEGCELEAGPDSFLASKTAASALAFQLGLTEQLIGTNEKDRRTFIVKKRRLVPIPKGTVMMVPGDWKAALASPLFGLDTKRRLIFELFAKRRNRKGDISVRDFVRDHFGPGALTYLTEPLLSGVYGGDPASLSARSVLPKFVGYEERFGSLIRGVRSEKTTNLHGKSSLFLSFRGGMSTLTDTLARSIRDAVCIVPGEAAKAGRREGKWAVTVSGQELEGEHLVLACPAHVSARLLAHACPELSQHLVAIPYSSAILVMLLFDRSSFNHPLNGFGFLVPRAERETIAAATWINTKFPSRIAPDLIGIRTFIVDPEASRERDTSSEELISRSLRDLNRLMGIRQSPIYSSVARWPSSMPQFVLGHEDRIRSIEHLEKASPGLHLASNYFSGVGIPDCIARAQKIANEIAKG